MVIVFVSFSGHGQYDLVRYHLGYILDGKMDIVTLIKRITAKYFNSQNLNHLAARLQQSGHLRGVSVDNGYSSGNAFPQI